MADKYKVKSDYTILRKKSQVTEKGDIFENDIMTITPLDTLFTEGQEVIYSDSNFKFSTRTDPDIKRKYNRNSWLKTPVGSEVWTLNDIDSAPISDESKIRIKPNYTSLRDFAYYGSAVDMVHATINHVIMYFPGELYFSSDEFQPIDRNGNYVTQISFSGQPYNPNDFKIVYNDFDINIETDYVNENNVINPNRYMTLSAGNYVMVKDGVVILDEITRQKFVPNPDYDGCGDGIIGYSIVGGVRIYVYIQDGVKIYIYNVTNIGIEANGELEQVLAQPLDIPVRVYGSLIQQKPNIPDIDVLTAYGELEQLNIDVINKKLTAYGILQQGLEPTRALRALKKNYRSNEEPDNGLGGISIRLREEYVLEYFETIDEFESTLLNRQNRPIYKATFETPYETEEVGYRYTMENYVWPSRNDWNPEINTIGFTSYVQKLISLAEYHDEFDSNNIWRMMTHEAIKNLDWTFFRENGDDVEDLSKIDSSRIEAIAQLYGRQYDGLKRYIDNIKYSNNITYNQKNNLPDYLLTDAVELAGFEAVLPNPTGKTNVMTNSLYSGLTGGYSEVDGNINFMRNLKINSNYINSLKGTKHGLEAILGLLGLRKNEYKITEHIGIAQGNDVCKINLYDLNGTPDDEAAKDRYECNFPSALDVESINAVKDNVSIDSDFYDIYEGIACKPITVVDDSGNTQGRYVIPWYENGKVYDSGLYFQMMGGWGKKPLIDVSELQIQGFDVKDFHPSGLIAGENFFDETKNRIKFAGSIGEMLEFLPNEVSEGDICFVGSIASLEEAMPEFPLINDEMTDASGNTVYSHYFVLENIDKSTSVSLFPNEGWRYVYLKDILNGSSVDGLRILYQESIIERTNGNNPHVAVTDYDGGSRYVELLSDIFNYCINNNELTTFSTLDVESAITTYNFNITSGYVDNRKVDYFRPKYLSDLTEIEQTDGNSYDCKNTLSEVECMIDVNDCPICDESGNTISDSCEKGCSQVANFLYNPEHGTMYETPASYSLVNLKNIKIEFASMPGDIAVEGTADDMKRFRDEWQTYVRKVVVEYLKQLLPSTTIFEWGFCGDFNVIGIEANGELEQVFSDVNIEAIGELEQGNNHRVLTAYGELIQNGTTDRINIGSTVHGKLIQQDEIINKVGVDLG